MSGPVLLIGLAVLVGVGGAELWLPLALGVTGLALGWFALFDFTTSVLVDENGISLIYPARRRLLAWDGIERLFNPRRRGLVAVTTSGQHHILIDRKLDPEELDALARKAASHGVPFKA
jgi:hypothetical protein